MKDWANFGNADLLRVGTAAWALPAKVRARFPDAASNLARYAEVFNCSEINSSFYRSHQSSTYARWAASVPDNFRFSVKVPKAITHEARLARCEAPLIQFLEEVEGLGKKLGCLLIQLPASFAFNEGLEAFFLALRKHYSGAAVLEPRHPSWFENAGESLMRRYAIARAAADPPPVPGALVPGGGDEIVYLRLHGSPRLYWSQYTPARIDAISLRMTRLAKRRVPVWCIFDNTAGGAATEDALALVQRLKPALAN